jgi:Family of unknown function (DUF5677)
MTAPIKNLIHRELPEDVAQLLNKFSETIDEFVNLGTNILAWNLHPKTPGEENVAPIMLFRHFLDIIDSISILVKNSCGDTCKILIRAAFEVTLYIEYLFEDDIYNRSMAFVVADTIKQIKTATKLDPTSDEGKKFYAYSHGENFLKNLNIAGEDVLKEFIKSKNKLLALPQFIETYRESERLKEMGEKNPNWYRYYDGPKNIESLATHLKQKTVYEMMYRKWSGAVHGSDITIGRLTKGGVEGMVNITQLRFIKDVQESVRYALIFSLSVFRLFVAKRIPEKQNEFTIWYFTIKNMFDQIISNSYITTK